MRQLPYLIVLNPSISQIYSIYFNSFRVVSQTKPPKTIEENAEFVEILDQLVQAHSDTIPILSRGFHEARQYISMEESSKILDTHLRARIGTRLIAEHHIALTNPIDPDEYIGAVEIACKPSRILKHTAAFVGDICDLKYGVVPQIKFDNPQGIDATIPYIPVHLEYMFTELLKNAFRASIEFAQKQPKKHNNNGEMIQEEEEDNYIFSTSLNEPLAPVLITIVKTSTGLIIRIRDRGGGIPPALENKVFDYSFTTFDDSQGEGDGVGSSGFSTLNAVPGGNSIAGLGYGLPLSRAYAEFFGGKLQIQTYYGWGTDVYITLKAPNYPK